MTPIVKQFKYGQHTVTLETGAIARQATAAVMAWTTLPYLLLSLLKKM